jgi:hypothetical protein
MAEELAKGQLSPIAKPVSTFLSFRSEQAAQPTQITKLDTPIGVNAIQRSNEMNVSGVNSITELKEALAPLTKVGDFGLQMYASDQYRRGQNEVARATALVNRQTEASSQQYAAENRSLARKNPAAALLMDQTNPFRQAGRINQASQIAATQISSKFRDLWVKNGGDLVKLDPSSPELNRVRANASAEVAAEWGLDEFSPGFLDYVIPTLNREWESFQDKHLQARTAYLKDTQKSLLQANLYARMVGWVPESETQDALVQSLGGMIAYQSSQMGLGGEPSKMTQEAVVGLYQQLALVANTPNNPLAGKARRLMGMVAQIPVGITGPGGTVLTAGMAYSLELFKGQDEVAQISRRNLNADIESESRSFEEKYGPRLTGLAPGSSEANAIYQEALRDPQFSTMNRADRIKALQTTQERESGFAGMQVDQNLLEGQFTQWSGQVGSDWNESKARARFNSLMAELPAAYSAKEKARLLERFEGLVKEKRSEQNGSIDMGLLNANLTSALKANLAERYPDITEAALQGMNVEGLLTYGDSARKRSTQAFASEFRTRGIAAIRAETARRGVSKLSTEQQQVVLDKVLEGMEKNAPLMNQLFPPLKGQKPGQGQKPPEAPAGTRPVSATTFAPARLNSAPQERIDQWKQVPLLSPADTEKMLAMVLNRQPLPSALRRAASRAGVTPEQLLLKQVDLYPRYNFGLTPDLRKQIQTFGNRAAGAQASIQGAPPEGFATAMAGFTNLMANVLTGTAPAYAASFNPSQGAGSLTGESFPVGPIGQQVSRFRKAIIGKESGGNYGAVNPDSGALGIGQVMPENVGPWTQRYLGRRLTPQQFLASKSAQDAVVNGRFQDMLKDQEAAGYRGEIAIRRAAAVWYSGRANLWNDTRPQYSNGRRYPSIAEYTRDIWARYRS